MKRNMGELDRLIRTLLAIVIAILIWAGVLSLTLGWILGGIGVFFLVTGFIRFCPLYLPLGISTVKKTKT